MTRRLSIGLLLTALIVALVPSIATASVDDDCTGSATIKGVTYTPDNDTPSKAIPIPDEPGIVVTYSGSVDFENKNDSGVAKVQVGPFGITLDKPWGGPNEQDVRGVDKKTYQLDNFRDALPIWIPGVWKVTATHSASGGECSGFAMIKLEGSPLGSAVGWVVIVGFLGFLYGLVEAIRRKRLVAAILTALFLGLFAALALMMWAIQPLDTLTVVVLPVVLVILAAGAVFLLRGRRTAF